MSTLLLCMLAPALLFCALKLSLSERLWEIFPATLVVGAAPLFLHSIAARVSVAGVDNMLKAPQTLDVFVALLALEALLTLLLIAAVLAAHSGAATAIPGSSALHAAGLPAGLAAFWAGGATGAPALLCLGVGLLLGVVLWPWGSRPSFRALLNRHRNLPSPGQMSWLVVPFWALLSPAFLAVAAGLQMHLFLEVSGFPLWRLTLIYAGGLFGGLSTLACLLRWLVPNWPLRIDAVMLLAFLLLMAAMFLPQLAGAAPPPDSRIHANWPATGVFAALTFGGAAAAVLQNRLNLRKRLAGTA